jgi:hypothetical protein
MMNRKPLLILVALLGLAACTKPSEGAFFNRGGPESLLDVSSEVVNLSVADRQAVNELTTWIQNDQPTRAELYCTDGDPRCKEARQVLELNGVPTMTVPSGELSVALVYERILARDCSQRYVDDGSNAWNAPHASFGCSIAANTVQHVSNKQQFIAPNLTDVPLATGAVQAYQRAYTPKMNQQQQQGYSINQSLTQMQGTSR